MARDLPCPSCGAPIPWRLARNLQAFTCPSCAHGLKVSTSYFLPLHYISIVLAVAGAYAVGLRGMPVLVVAVVATYVIVGPIVRAVAVRLVRPDLEETGDYKAVLFGAHPASSDDDELVEGDEGPERDEGTFDRAPRLFKSPPQPRTLEGTAIALGFLLLGAFFAWASLEPLLVAHVPGYWVTRNGPPQMPLTARVTRDYMELNNATDILLLCRLRLNAGAVGNPTRYVESGRSVWYLETQVYLEPGKSKIVGYLDLPGVDTDVEVRAVRLAALGEIGLECGSSSVSLN